MSMYDDEREDERDATASISHKSVRTGDGIELTLSIMPPTDEQIADSIARRYCADYSVSEALQAAISDRFDVLIRHAVDAAAKGAIERAMAATRQKTDEFGNPIGEPQTFAGMIGAQVKAWQEETVDSDGRPKAKDRYSSYVFTRAEWLVRQVGAEEFAKIAKEEVAKVKLAAKASIDSAIKNAVAAAISGLVAK